MPKQVTVDLDPRDSLEARLLLDYIAAADQQQWLKRCLLLGYLVITGEIEVVDPDEAANEDMSPAQPKRPKGIGNQLFGIPKR
jgi:hypothetical protein